MENISKAETEAKGVVRPDAHLTPTFGDYVLRGIVFAGAFFPPAYVLCFRPWPDLANSTWESLGEFCSCLAFGMICDGVFAGINGLIVNGLIGGLLRIVSLRYERLAVAGLVGGMAVAMSAGNFVIPRPIGNSGLVGHTWEAIVLATLMGQVGGIGGAVCWTKRKKHHESSNPKRTARFRFQVSHLLGLTLLIALLLTTLRMLGVPLARLSFILGGWAVLQSISLGVFLICARLFFGHELAKDPNTTPDAVPLDE